MIRYGFSEPHSLRRTGRSAAREHGRARLVVIASVTGAILAVICVALYAASDGGATQPSAAALPSPHAKPPAPPAPPVKTVPHWKDLPVDKAPYSPPRITPQPAATDGAESAPHERPRESPFDRAMRAYTRNDFGRAATALAPLARGGDPRANFYLGVSYLLLERNEDAVSALERAVRSSGGSNDAQTHYYLAVAYLRGYRFEEALRELTLAQERNGPYASRAAELEDEVRSSAL
jgi:tetratricopeptide (TPR) repeat protein